MQQNLITNYIDLTLIKNATPENVYLFAKHCNISEEEFYQYFSSLESLEQSIFEQWWVSTENNVKSSEVYNNYSTRERVLALFFTWIESLKKHRTFVLFLHQRDSKKFPVQMPAYLKKLKHAFTETIKPILADGIESKEITERKFISDKYSDALWANLLFVTQFWIKDQSASFEKTDESIEKSVNLAFELMGKSPLDSAIEFGKFLFQNK